jgi:hypothetical protein
MKKLISLFILIFAFQFCFSQEINMTKDTIGLHEVVIAKGSNKKLIRQFVKQIRRNLRENYNLGNVNYLTNHLFVKDDKDTLVKHKMLNNLIIKVLNKFEIHSMLLDDPKNPFHADISPYTRFETSVPNYDHGLALRVYYDSLPVSDFDFFENISNYEYKISKLDSITTVTFIGAKFYSGYFSFNTTNYNLIRIVFKNTKPYDWYSWGLEGNPQQLEFNSQWKCNKLTILLDFKEMENGRLLLKKLDAMEELTQFEFKRYFPGSKRVIDQDSNIKFYTTLSMRLLY